MINYKLKNSRFSLLKLISPITPYALNTLKALRYLLNQSSNTEGQVIMVNALKLINQLVNQLRLFTGGCNGFDVLTKVAL